MFILDKYLFMPLSEREDILEYTAISFVEKSLVVLTSCWRIPVHSLAYMYVYVKFLLL